MGKFPCSQFIGIAEIDNVSDAEVKRVFRTCVSLPLKALGLTRQEGGGPIFPCFLVCFSVA